MEYENLILDDICHIITSGDILCDITRAKNVFNINNLNYKLQLDDNFKSACILKIDGSVL